MFVYDKISKRVEYFDVWLEDHTAWRVAMPGNKALRERSPAAAMPRAIGCANDTAHKSSRKYRQFTQDLACHKTLSVTAIMQPWPA